ncbi:hypothetical protein BX070DRAFT_145444 [Coemansia spiralis]|nr:hypothetical protein BX070DRAFT_145444 [Coemansia spiralis]
MKCSVSIVFVGFAAFGAAFAQEGYPSDTDAVSSTEAYDSAAVGATPIAVAPPAMNPPNMAMPEAMLPGAMLPGAMLPGAMLPGAMLPGAMLPGAMSTHIGSMPSAIQSLLSRLVSYFDMSHVSSINTDTPVLVSHVFDPATGKFTHLTLNVMQSGSSYYIPVCSTDAITGTTPASADVCPYGIQLNPVPLNVVQAKLNIMHTVHSIIKNLARPLFAFSNPGFTSASQQTVPQQVAPEQTAPEQTAPEQTAPEQMMASQTIASS